MNQSDILIVGAGVYGVTAALALRARGYSVTLLDPGPLPHPLAASTDVSKVVRMEYGRDAQYMQMVDRAIDGWHAWNATFGAPLYHETGVAMLTRAPLAAGGYVYESYRLLQQAGHVVERLDADAIARRFPAWSTGHYVDGIFNPRGGYAESGRVVAALLAQAQRAGVMLHVDQTAATLIDAGARVVGVRTRSGDAFHADHVLLAAGTWTQYLLPELHSAMRSSGHPVFHLRTDHPTLFTQPNFCVFTADIEASGWYGFPLHPREGIIKIANHGVGQLLDPEHDARLVTDADVAALRRFLTDTFPLLATAPIVYTRRCLYCDTRDEHFWIDRHPTRPGLAVAAGGSGHGFKFAPVLGDLIADAVEGKPNAWSARFRWRTFDSAATGQEASRFHGDGAA